MEFVKTVRGKPKQVGQFLRGALCQNHCVPKRPCAKMTLCQNDRGSLAGAKVECAKLSGYHLEYRPPDYILGAGRLVIPRKKQVALFFLEKIARHLCSTYMIRDSSE